MTQEQKEDYYTLHDVVDLFRSFFKYLKKRSFYLLLAAGLGALAGTGYYFIQQPKYQAVSTFILEEKSIGGGALAGIASQFGFNLGGLTGGGSIFSGDNILNILKSKKVVQKVLLTAAGEKNDITLADLYAESSGLKNKWKKEPQLASVTFNTSMNNELAPLQDSLLGVMYEKILDKNLSTQRTSKEGSIISVEIEARDRNFARLMASRLVDEASAMYLDIRLGTAQDNIFQLQSRSDSLLRLLNNKSYSAAAVQPLDINPAVRTAVVPGEIANRDKNVLATLYAEVTKNLELSKVLLTQQTPVIQKLDQPSELLDDNRKSLLFLLVVVSFVGVCLYAGAAFLYYLFKINKP